MGGEYPDDGPSVTLIEEAFEAFTLMAAVVAESAISTGDQEPLSPAPRVSGRRIPPAIPPVFRR